jgi:hypothetical protein
MSSLSVLKQDSISSLDMLFSLLLFEFGLSSNKVSSKDNLDDVSNHGVSV